VKFVVGFLGVLGVLGGLGESSSSLILFTDSC